MKTILILLILAFSTSLFSSNWDNALGQAAGKMDLRLLSYSEIGISDDNNLSLKFHPLSVFLSPSIDLKYAIPEKEIAFSFGINYPTPLLKLVQNKGAGGFLSPEFDIPQMLSLRFTFEENLKVNDWLNFYSNIWFEYSPFNKLHRDMMIDMPIIAPQMAIYAKTIGFNASVSVEGNIAGDFNYYTKLVAYVFPLTTENISEERQKYLPNQEMNAFVEINPMIIWNICNSFQLAAGAKITNGSYLFGTVWNTWPHLDFKQSIQF